ncbi:hypothetical protein FACS1894167_04750 [Synergistales bacterium]|nr:hypothetical protein FACS1894167_04750 [Synergistales bacterium]
MQWYRQFIHHNSKGSQYTAKDFIKLPELYGVRASIGSVGDSYGNALTESVSGAYARPRTPARGRKPP